MCPFASNWALGPCSKCAAPSPAAGSLKLVVSKTSVIARLKRHLLVAVRRYCASSRLRDMQAWWAQYELAAMASKAAAASDATAVTASATW